MWNEFRCSAGTDRGLVRENNEDSFLTEEDARLCVVCDGLGGHAAGEIASTIAVETMGERIREASSEPKRFLRDLISDANRRIISDQRLHPERMGMGTTLTALWVPDRSKREAWVGHVGDSRLYRLRAGKFEQITNDHSPVFRLYQEGALTKDDLRRHPQKNLIERSLGLSLEVDSDVFAIELEKGDRYLLCTDGLSDCVSDADMEQVCRTAKIEKSPEQLIKLALSCGGFDNVTVVVVDIL